MTGQHVLRILLFLFSHPGLHVCALMRSSFMWVLGLNQAPCLHGKYLTSQAISPALSSAMQSNLCNILLKCHPHRYLRDSWSHLALIPITDWSQVLNLKYSNATDQGAFLIPSDVLSSTNRID